MKLASRLSSATLCTAALASLASAALAQQPGVIPVRPLGRIVASSTEMLGSIDAIRPLSDGRVLVNDPMGKRLVLFDSTLAHFTTVADTTSETAKAYGGRGGGILAYSADSSLFADMASMSLLVIEPNGKINRVIAAPKGNGNGVVYLRGPSFGAAFDGRGNIVSKWPSPRGTRDSSLTGPPPRDSAQIQRANIVTKKIDTVAKLQASNGNLFIPPSATNKNFTIMNNPLPVADSWTVMPDGTIAIISEIDYHIDWITPDGKRTSSPKIQHQWEHMTDSMKAAVVDSAKRADSISDAKEAALAASANASGRGAPAGNFVVVGGGVAIGSFSGGGLGGGAGNVAIAPQAFSVTTQYVDPGDLPDYYPPFFAADTLGVGPAKPDADGNIWIRTAHATHVDGGTIFDVVNRQGQLVDRVQIPGGTTIMGFGPGVVYLSARVGTGYQLARAKIH